MRLGLLGGTFDPVHLGHLEAAEAARAALGLDEVHLVPARVPPHRRTAPQASAYHRFAMVVLAVLDHEGLAASDVELRAPAPSYTVDTLARLARLGYHPSQLFFITGADAFAEIATWKQYPALLDRANFVVVSRPGWSAATVRDALPAIRDRMRSVGAGDVSPAALARPAVFLLDAATTDVSSTLVRERLAHGESIAGLVPEAVARHIARHRLYAARLAADPLHE
jgi:nicotinate-nucleotide adenylyltransferase